MRNPIAEPRKRIAVPGAADINSKGGFVISGGSWDVPPPRLTEGDFVEKMMLVKLTRRRSRHSGHPRRYHPPVSRTDVPVDEPAIRTGAKESDQVHPQAGLSWVRLGRIGPNLM